MSKILSGTRNGEITDVAIRVAPLGRVAVSGAARMPGKANEGIFSSGRLVL